MAALRTITQSDSGFVLWGWSDPPIVFWLCVYCIRSYRPEPGRTYMYYAQKRQSIWVCFGPSCLIRQSETSYRIWREADTWVGVNPVSLWFLRHAEGGFFFFFFFFFFSHIGSARVGQHIHPRSLTPCHGSTRIWGLGMTVLFDSDRVLFKGAIIILGDSFAVWLILSGRHHTKVYDPGWSGRGTDLLSLVHLKWPR